MQSKCPLSPCFGVCRVANSICTGCQRSLDEIRDWGRYSEAQKRAVLARPEVQGARAKFEAEEDE